MAYNALYDMMKLKKNYQKNQDSFTVTTANKENFKKAKIKPNCWLIPLRL